MARALAAGLLLALVSTAGSPLPARAEGAPATRRLAVVVGANAAAPGRKPLRFAHDDARAVAQVLRDLGGFGESDVRLLFDPQPEQVLDALDTALGEAAHARVDTLVIFYYSGHADTASLFPGGRALPLAKLRQRLEDSRAAMRIGIIDACRGGGWTGSKGLSPSQTFAIEQALDLSTQGSVLIASSSGLEDAHESVALRGSFFTHHWNAGLRGAADRNGDDKVTLNEAFEYARSLTIRDTALNTENPQHPSFRFNLRGRGDPQLAELSPGRSLIELTQESGPLQIIHLGTGLLVVELPAGRRQVRVSLPPGRYVVRQRVGQTLHAREVRLGTGQRLSVSESSLTPVRVASLELKGVEALSVESAEPDRPAPAAPRSELQLSAVASPRVYSGGDTFWGLQGSLMARHGTFLATRVGLGFLRPEWPGDGAVLASVGESVSWPFLRLCNRIRGGSQQVCEPYLTAQVSVRAGLHSGDWAHQYQVQGNLAAGLRRYSFFAQAGGLLDLIGGPRPGLIAEAGFRVVRDIL